MNGVLVGRNAAAESVKRLAKLCLSVYISLL
jgi:hypothetical protein